MSNLLGKTLFSLLLTILSFTLYAQTILTGTVRNAAGQPLEGILLEVTTRTQPPVTAFVISAVDGSFKLTIPATPTSDSLYLHARALGYAEQLRRLSNHNQLVAFTLQESTTTLEEITVRGAPITRQGDTLSYKVDAFASKQDRVISDVLKKMPGIEVAPDGQIRYEGKPISKFYINGQDLLESRYTLASDNLPADAVQSVQVLERHQPIRALDSLARPDNAALNLQLKKKVTATGQARLGAGLVPRPLAPLWNVNISPMLFAGRQQFLDSYQSNNTGQDVATELKPLTLDDLQQQSESSHQKPDLTHIQGLGQPPVGVNRYLFNKVHLLSANHLVTIRKENQLRVNASYLHDAQTQRGSSQTFYYLPDNRTVALTERKTNRLYFNNVLADLAFIKNEKRYYLKNTLSVDGRWDSQTGDLYRAESQQRIVQQAANPFVGLTNRLRLVRPLQSGRVVQVSSLLFYTDSPQRLAVSPGPFAGVLTNDVPYDTARQHTRQRTFFTSNSVGLTTSQGHWAYSGTAGFSEEIQRLTSTLQTSAETGSAPLPLRNDLHWNRGRYYLESGLSYKTDTWQVSLSAPVSYYSFWAADALLDAKQRLQTVVAEPSVSVRYGLGPLWYASAGSSLKNRFGGIDQLNYAFILRDYRTLQRNDAPLARIQTQQYQAGLYFKNPLKSLFFNTLYSFSASLNNRLYSSQIEANGALTTEALNRDNWALTHSLTGSISQFISPWKTNLRLQLSGNYRQQPQVLNSILVQTHTHSAIASLRTSVSAFEWGNLEYNATLTALRSTISNAPSTPVALLQDHYASVSVFPVKSHQATLAANYYNSRGPGPAVRAFFADFTYRYTLPTARKIDLELRWSNIFDTQQYQYSFVSPFQFTQTIYQLRPAQVLVSVHLSL